MFCALFLLTLYLSMANCPQWLAGTRALIRGGGGVTRLPPPPPRPSAPYQSRPGMVVVVMAADPAPATPPPRGGTRDSTPYLAGGCLYAHIPRGRPGAPRGAELANLVAGGPTLE